MRTLSSANYESFPLRNVKQSVVKDGRWEDENALKNEVVKPKLKTGRQWHCSSTSGWGSRLRSWTSSGAMLGQAGGIRCSNLHCSPKPAVIWTWAFEPGPEPDWCPWVSKEGSSLQASAAQNSLDNFLSSLTSAGPMSKTPLPPLVSLLVPTAEIMYLFKIMEINANCYLYLLTSVEKQWSFSNLSQFK